MQMERDDPEALKRAANAAIARAHDAAMKAKSGPPRGVNGRAAPGGAACGAADSEAKGAIF